MVSTLPTYLRVPITPTKRARIVALRDAGWTFSTIAQNLGISVTAAKDNYKKFSKTRDFYRPIQRPGPRHKMDAAERRLAVRKIRSHVLKGRRKRKVPFLTKAHVLKRKHWAWEHLEWTVDNWGSVVFSDESKFNLFGSDGIQYCRRGPHEEFDKENVQPRLKHGGGSAMVWGCMTRAGFGRLVRVKGNMDAAQYCRILQKGLLGTFDDLGVDSRDFIFQQDNDPKHTSRRARTWLTNHGIDVLPWPPNTVLLQS